MKNIKTLLIAGLLITTTGVFAQDKKVAKKKTIGIAQTVSVKEDTPEIRAEKQTNLMKEELNLTPQQTEKVSVLNTKVEQKIQAIIDGNLPEEKKKAFIAGNMKDKLAALSTILDDKQIAKYKALVASNKL